MNRFFSIPAILRLVPSPVLQEFFQRMGFDSKAVHWQHLAPGEIRPIIEAISTMTAGEQTAIEETLRQISDLACDSGIAAFRAAGGSAVHLQLSDGPLCAAMRIWIEHPEVFNLAAALHQVDHLERWHRRVGPASDCSEFRR